MYSTSTLKRIYLTYIRHVVWKTGVEFIVLICQLCSTFWPVRSLITPSSLWKHDFVRHSNMAIHVIFVGFFLGCFMLLNQTFLDRQLSCISGDVLLFTIALQLKDTKSKMLFQSKFLKKFCQLIRIHYLSKSQIWKTNPRNSRIFFRILSSTGYPIHLIMIWL